MTILAAVDDSTDDTQDDASNEDSSNEDAAEDTAETTSVTEVSGPNTGDESNLLLYVMLLAAAIGVCTYWAIKRKKLNSESWDGGRNYRPPSVSKERRNRLRGGSFYDL